MVQQQQNIDNELSTLYDRLLVESEHVVNDLELMAVVVLRSGYPDWERDSDAFMAMKQIYSYVKKIADSLECSLTELSKPDRLHHNSHISREYIDNLKELVSNGRSLFDRVGDFELQRPYINCIVRFYTDCDNLMKDMEKVVTYDNRN